MSRKRAWNDGQLFDKEKSDLSLQGGGFKNKEKAEETLKLLDGRDITYQYNVIRTLHNRAKVIIKRTKDPEKLKNLTEAENIFESWIKDYKDNSRHKENLAYLPVEVVESYEKLAKFYKIEDNGLLNVYKEANGDHKLLRNMKVDGSETTWDVQRNRKLQSLLKTEQDLFSTEGDLNGLPSKEHVELIMWAYSPEANKVKKAVDILKAKKL